MKKLSVAVAAARAKAACNTPSKPGSAPAGDPIAVFGRVLGESDALAGKYAEFADRSRIAGLACEQSYDAVRQQLQ